MNNSANDLFIKAGSTAAVAFALNQFYLNESDFRRNAVFAFSTGAGVALGNVTGSIVPAINLPVLGNGKGLGQRAVEIGLGSGVTYAVNKYVMGNSTYKETFMQKIGIIVVADLAGEYIADFIAGRPLSILA
jgi:hypothetical protein